jgi:hypothetical protein
MLGKPKSLCIPYVQSQIGERAHIAAQDKKWALPRQNKKSPSGDRFLKNIYEVRRHQGNAIGRNMSIDWNPVKPLPPFA